MQLLLIRHGESTWNATGRWQGQSDVPLSPRGQLQARALATRMYGGAADHRITSDLLRASETAAAVGPGAVFDKRFREIDVGEWAGLKRAEVAEKFPAQVRALRGGDSVRIGGGESMDEFEGRVDATVDSLRQAHAGKRVHVFTHGGVVRALATRALSVRGRQSPLVGVANTAMSLFDVQDGALRLATYNDSQHLDASDQDSAMFRAPEPMTRVVFVAAEPDAEADRALTDALLSSLGIAEYFALEGVGGALGEELLADPLAGDPSTLLEELRADHEHGAFGIVAEPSLLRELIGELLELDPGGVESLVEPRHGAIAQLRITARGSTLHSWGVSLGENP